MMNRVRHIVFMQLNPMNMRAKVLRPGGNWIEIQYGEVVWTFLGVRPIFYN